MNVGEVEEVRFKNKPSDIFWFEVFSREALYVFCLFVCLLVLFAAVFFFLIALILLKMEKIDRTLFRDVSGR